MIFPRSGLIAVSLAALLAAGCSSSRFSSEDTTPEPLTPAPVRNGDRRPAAATAGPATAGSQFPAAPGTDDRCRGDAPAAGRAAAATHPT